MRFAKEQGGGEPVLTAPDPSKTYTRPTKTGLEMEKYLRGGSDRRSFCSPLAQRSPAPGREASWLDREMAEDRGTGLAFNVAASARGVAETLELPAIAARHGVHFHSTDVGAVGAVADMFEAAIAGGESMLLVATADHRAGVEGERRGRGARLDQAGSVGPEMHLLSRGSPICTRMSWPDDRT